MADTTRQFPRFATSRDAFAVYAVAMGDNLGLETEHLVRLRRAVESKSKAAVPELDEILEFLEHLETAGLLGEYPIPESIGSGRLADAYRAVAPLIQPLG